MESMTNVAIPGNIRDYFTNPSKLFQLIESESKTEASIHAKENPDEAKNWVVRKSSDGTTSWRRLPLHEACIRDPSECLVDALIKAYPTGVKEVDACGRLPLHHACVHGASEAVILKLIMNYPESISVKDTWEKTPLAIAEVSSNANKLAVYSHLSKGVAFYYRKIVEKEWIENMEVEKKKHESMLKTMETKYKIRIADINESNRNEKLENNHKIGVMENEISSLQSENERLKRELKKSNEEATYHETEHKKMKENLAKYVTSLQKFQKDMSSSENKSKNAINALNNLVDTLQSERDKDQNEIKQLKNELIEKNLRIKNDEKKFCDLIKHEKDKYESNRNMMNLKLTNLSEQKDSIEKVYSDALVKLEGYDTLKSKIVSIIASLNLLNSNHEEILAAVANQKKELISLESSRLKTLRSIGEAQINVASAINDIVGPTN